MPHTEHISEEMRHCIDDCQECAAICLETSNHCLMLGGRHAEAGHIRLLLDCAEVCQTTAGLLLRASALYRLQTGVCAEACRQCASSCDQFPEDATMQLCTRICRKCAESCDLTAGGGRRRAGG
jgi:hypothetical protein